MALNWTEFGFMRLAAVSPGVVPGDPAANGARLAAEIAWAADEGAALVLTPELSLTGYSCEDLFAGETLPAAAEQALADLLAATERHPVVWAVGMPWRLADGRLVNGAVLGHGGRVAGVVPKLHPPFGGEFHERRWFVPGPRSVLRQRHARFGEVPVGGELLFALGETLVGVEICEDLWAPAPPSVDLALAGAQVILNLSASNEVTGKADWRRDLVRVQSGRLHAAYAYASAGPDESTKDTVYGGHLLVAEDGRLIGEREPLAPSGDGRLTVDLDVAALRHERDRDRTFAAAERKIAPVIVDLGAPPAIDALRRAMPARPFVPEGLADRRARVHEILAVQAAGLARRLAAVGDGPAVIGVSGGLDSTWALLVTRAALVRRGRPPTEGLLAVTMPGPGTSEHTLGSVRALAEACGLTLRTIPIGPAVDQHLRDIDHPADVHDVTFENAQARERTQILFDLANQVGGLVVGTGDMSELALGWATFNGDHMSGYGVNAGLPKSLIRHLIEVVAEDEGPALAEVLRRIAATPVSPELLPPAADGSIAQRTEDVVGPYDLHDFFLYHLLRRGAGPRRIRALASVAFAGEYDEATIDRWLRVFLRRFFSQQFKRTTMPPGPKIGTVALSPRGDWRMPDEATAAAWLRELDESGA